MVHAIDPVSTQSDIDADRIGVWGMSQGGWIAPLAASRSTDIAFVIAVSAAGVSPACQMLFTAKCELIEHGFSTNEIDSGPQAKEYIAALVDWISRQLGK